MTDHVHTDHVHTDRRRAEHAAMPLDGNAIAGALADVFGTDLTTAIARCRGCGHLAMLATAVVWAATPGYVVRCRGCDGVLATLVVADGRTWFAMPGIAALELSPGR